MTCTLEDVAQAGAQESVVVYQNDPITGAGISVPALRCTAWFRVQPPLYAWRVVGVCPSLQDSGRRDYPS